MRENGIGPIACSDLINTLQLAVEPETVQSVTSSPYTVRFTAERVSLAVSAKVTLSSVMAMLELYELLEVIEREMRPGEIALKSTTDASVVVV